MSRKYPKNADIFEARREDSRRYYFAIRDTRGRVISTPGRTEQKALELALDELPGRTADDLMRVPKGWTAGTDRGPEGEK